MTNDRIFCLWVATATLAVTFACCAGCTARLSLPAVEYAVREFHQPASRPVYQLTAEQVAAADKRYEDYIETASRLTVEGTLPVKKCESLTSVGEREIMK